MDGRKQSRREASQIARSFTGRLSDVLIDQAAQADDRVRCRPKQQRRGREPFAYDPASSGYLYLSDWARRQARAA